MNAPVAILIFSAGISVLFYLDKNKSARNSRALWVPVIWLCMAGGRGIVAWFGIDAPYGGLNGTLEGSPVDAAVYGALLAIGVLVLLGRRKKASAYLPLMIPIIVYSAYCLISVTWSPIPVSALKRWSKDVGDVVVALIIATDVQPFEALRRFFSRVGFILLPFSVALIRYTTMGRSWDADGTVTFVGVATDKNTLGLIVFVISLGTVWNFRSLLVNRGEPNRGRRLVAQGVLLAFGLELLYMANSSTSVACFTLGSALMLATSHRMFRSRPARVHMLCLAILLTGALIELSGGTGDVAHALGRKSDLTGRADIWAAVIPAAVNPIVGAGFDSFWNSPGEVTFARNLNRLHWYHAEGINEAHDGYIEVYLNLGWVGVCLIAIIMIDGYRRACKAFQRDPEVASLILAYIIAGAFYSITEAGFRTLSPMWIFLLLSFVSASGVSAGFFERKKTKNPCLPPPQQAEHPPANIFGQRNMLYMEQT